MTANGTPVLVGLDWGTTSCRAYLIADDATVLGRRTSGGGVMPVTARAGRNGTSRGEAFEGELLSLCRDWPPGLPVIAGGMVGSTQGWVDAGYVDLPADLMADPLPLVEACGGGTTVHVVPGLRSPGPLPDLIRGEEVQVLGALLLEAGAGDRPDGARVMVLPGTHTKWVMLSESTITGFSTVLTGELYGVLLSSSILGRGREEPGGSRWSAFDRGVDVALGEVGRRGLPATLFSARSLVVTGQMEPGDVDDYLSGLLIGQEVAAMTVAQPGDGTVTLCGTPDLCDRYRRVLERVGRPARVLGDDPVPRALLHIARRAGLLAPPDPAEPSPSRKQTNS